ncbi:MAG TPA: hypothetical protein DDW65_01180 [Firmicutes bacterium]|nr:hypothetical protein [Bacillota bacterium]
MHTFWASKKYVAAEIRGPLKLSFIQPLGQPSFYLFSSREKQPVILLFFEIASKPKPSFLHPKSKSNDWPHFDIKFFGSIYG